MALWDMVTRFLALDPMAEQARSIEEFPDLETQLANLHRQPSVWRAASIEEALGVPAILSAVSLIANTVGSLSMEAYDQGRLITDQLLVPRIVVRPNPYSTARDFYRDTAFYLATRGEAWWWVARRDVDDLPMSLYPVPPWEVTVAQNDRNRLFPTIEWQGRKMENRDMRHITYLPDHMNLRGVGPLQFCGAAASVAVESQEWAANFFAGNLPSVIGESEVPMDETELKALDAQWLEKDKSNLPRWISGGMKLKDFAIDPAKAQLNEQRDFQVGEVARMFEMPGALLNYNAPGSSLTYQNDEQVWSDFQRRCLGPHYLEPIEQEMSDLLVRTKAGRFNLKQLLRADAKTRFDTYAIGVPLGVYSVEEARQEEGLAPGNVDFMPVPSALPSSIPSILPPDTNPRSVDPVRCDGKRILKGLLRPCGKLLAEAGPFIGRCPRCDKMHQGLTAA